MHDNNDIAVYIHWPFCKSKCPYCDFYKELYINVNQDDIINEYIISLYRYHELLPDRCVKSVFFGGGTPSLILPHNIEKILNTICKLWPLCPDSEISLEANPNTDSATLFSDLKQAGINRLSLGVQALNDTDLHFLGRTHNTADARQCLEKIVKTFDNHSADLIYARPEQKLAQWQNELKEITSYGLRHLSLYQLTIEENTVFARKNIKPLSDDKALEMYKFSGDFLAAENYPQYEVSNYAVPQFASRHNLNYWQGGEYIGIGKSAHGRLKINNKHIATVYPFIDEELTPEQRAEELIIMGLRLVQGINKAEFKQICGMEIADYINQEKLKLFSEAGLLEETSDYLRATKQGFVLLTQIIAGLCI